MQPIANRDWYAVGILALVAFGLCAVHHQNWRNNKIPLRPTLDERADLDRAEQLDRGQWPDAPFYQAPLYPYFLFVVSKVINASHETPRYLQFACVALTAVLTFLLGRMLHSFAAGLLAGGLIALYKPLIFFSRLHLKSALVVLLITAVLTLYVSGRRRDSLLQLSAAGLLLGLACLGRGNLLLFIPILGGWLFTQPATRTRRTLLAACFVIAAALPIAPATWHNYQSGSLVLTTWQAGGVFYTGNHRGNRNGGYAAPGFIRTGTDQTRGEGWQREAARRTGRKMSQRQVSVYWMREGLAELVSEPMRAIKLNGRKLLLFWNRYEMPCNVDLQFMAQLDGFLRLPLPDFGWLALLAPGALWLLWRTPGARPLAVYLLLSWLVISAFFVAGRYRLPLAPILAVGAGMFLIEFWACLRAGNQRRRLLASLALILVGGTLAFRPVEQMHQADSYLQLGVSYEENGDAERATIAYEQAISINPRDATALARLGDLHHLQGRLIEASRRLHAATDIAPDQPEFNNSLGVVYFARALRATDANEPRHATIFLDLSERYLKQAALLLPARPEGHRNLAKLYRLRGQFEKALFHAKMTVGLMYFDKQGQEIMAYSLANMGRFKEAARAYWRLRRQNPKGVEGYIGEAQCYRLLEQPAKLREIEALIRQRFPRPQADRAIATIRGKDD